MPKLFHHEWLHLLKILSFFSLCFVLKYTILMPKSNWSSRCLWLTALYENKEFDIFFLFLRSYCQFRRWSGISLLNTNMVFRHNYRVFSEVDLTHPYASSLSLCCKTVSFYHVAFQHPLLSDSWSTHKSLWTQFSFWLANDHLRTQHIILSRMVMTSKECHDMYACTHALASDFRL